MPNEWIIEVLTDLRSFARQNGMLSLASELDATLTVARRDLAGPGAATHAGAEGRPVRGLGRP